MGFRINRRIKLVPGLTVNIGKRGVSTSVGFKGAHVTVGHGKVRETVGFPGSGLSYTNVKPTERAAEPSSATPAAKPIGVRGLGWLAFLIALFGWILLTRH